MRFRCAADIQNFFMDQWFVIKLSNIVEEKRRQRFEFLYALYNLSNGKENSYKDTLEIGRICRFKRDIVFNIVAYLKGEGLVDYLDFGNQVAITHPDVIHIEEALSKPDIETKYFPPAQSLNINIIHTMVNSSIQQNSPHAQQKVIINEKNIQEIAKIIQLMKRSLYSLGLDAESLSDLQAEIQRLETELSLSKPKDRIIDESLLSAMEILGKVANISGLATTIINMTNNLVPV
jgi:hypothetical protein